MRILVVEDEPKMTALLARALTEEGHTVRSEERFSRNAETDLLFQSRMPSSA